MDDEGASTGGLFEDPDGYYPTTPPPTTQTHRLLTRPDQTITLHLVGHSPLEAHHLWNGSKLMSNYLEMHPELVQGRTVLELGAGAGLPSLVAAMLGARKVVMTDFPDADLVLNMERNIHECPFLSRQEHRAPVVVAKGYVWGRETEPLLDAIRPDTAFDVLILADLLFRHSEHGHLLDTISSCLKKTEEAKALVFFTSYRSWLRHRDMAFFDLARERGFVVNKLLEKKMEKPLFENDPGDVEVQKTVTGWVVRWPDL